MFEQTNVLIIKIYIIEIIAVTKRLSVCLLYVSFEVENSAHTNESEKSKKISMYNKN